MVDIEIPRDIRVYESKLVGPFTTRQAACVGIGAFSVFTVYNTLKDVMATDFIFGVGFFIMAPLALFGWFRPYGMKLEQFLMTAFISNVVCPKNRKYMMEMQYALATAPKAKGEARAEKARRKMLGRQGKGKFSRRLPEGERAFK